MKTTERFLFALAALAAAASLTAAEVSPDQARTASLNWIRNHGGQNRRVSASNSLGVQTSKNDAGRALYHVVGLAGGGYVVTSGDTKLPPVVAFSETGAFRIADVGNPLRALLERDMRGRVGIVDGAGAVNRLLPEASAFEAEWAALTGSDPYGSNAVGPGSDDETTGVESIPDVRVAPLVKSKWDQNVWDDKATFNSCTPNNYSCGCVATAFGQIMRYWKKPTASVTPKTRYCHVDGVAVNKTMIGGVYDWDNMPLTSDKCTTDAQRKEIGKLTYDIGVVSCIDWARNGSGAFGTASMFSLKSVFGYSSAVGYYAISDSGLTTALKDNAAFRNAILASLDARMPCAIGVGNRSENTGHEVVIDGYGCSGSVIYCHVNCGWSGSEDLWYNLLGDKLTSYSFDFADELAYNIHPTVAGDVVSGRVLDSAGGPIAGATVTLVQGRTTKGTATTDAKGIYYFRVGATGNYTVQATSGSVQKSVAVSLTMSRTTSVIVNERGGLSYYNPSYDCGQLGNKWGVDITLDVAPATYVLRLHRNNSDRDGATAGRTLTVGKARALPKMASELKWAPRTGYDFLGWAKSATATTAQYTDGQSVKDLTTTKGATVHLYAVWKAHKYIVRLHRNNSKSDGATTGRAFDYDQVRFLPTMAELKWVRAGHMFMGWSQSQSSDKVKYADGLNVYNLSPNEGEELHVWGVWKVAPAGAYLLRLHRNNSERDGATAGRQLMLNTSRRLPSLSELGWTRGDAKFKGWAATAKDAAAGRVAHSNCASVRNLATATGATVHLYAVWQ